jgi:hypothetical protein
MRPIRYTIEKVIFAICIYVNAIIIICLNWLSQHVFSDLLTSYKSECTNHLKGCSMQAVYFCYKSTPCSVTSVLKITDLAKSSAEFQQIEMDPKNTISN